MKSDVYNGLISVGQWIEIGEYYDYFYSFSYSAFVMNVTYGYSHTALIFAKFGKEREGKIHYSRLAAKAISTIDTTADLKIGFKISEDGNKCKLLVKACNNFSCCTVSILGIASERNSNYTMWGFNMNVLPSLLQDEDMDKINILYPIS